MSKAGRILKKYRYVALILGGVGLYFALKKGPEPIMSDQVQTVGYQTIKDAVQAVGEVKLLNEQNLTFPVGGIIDKVFVAIGDPVAAGTVLAEISSAKQRNQIAQAQKSYELSKIRLNEFQGGGKGSTLIQLQNDIQQNQLKLQELDQQIPLTEVQISNDISKNEDQVREIDDQIALLEEKQQTLLNELDEIKLAQGNDGEKTIETNRTAVNIARNELQSLKLKAQDQLSVLDSVYGVTAQKASERNRAGLGARNTQLLSDGYAATQKLISTLKNLNTSLTTSATTEDIDLLVQISDQIIAFLEDMQLLASHTQNMLQNRSVEGGDLTPTRSQTYQSQMDQILSWTANGILSLQNSKKALLTIDSEELTDLKNTNTVQSKELELQDNERQLALQESARNQLILANQQLSLDKTFQVTQQNNTQKNLANQISLLQTQLTEQKSFNGGTKYDLEQARQELELQGLQIEQAKLALKDYQLIAYEDGTVIDFDFRVGENLAVSATNNYMTIGTPDKYEIELMLDQVDVIKLKVGMRATIELNAVADTIFSGTVTEISTVPVKENNVNSYKVTVAFENNDKTLVSGMIGTVTIDVETKNNVLAVPLTAVVYSGEQGLVTLYQSGDTMESVTLQEVKLGSSDLLWVEILSGVRAGQSILTIGKNISGPVVPGFTPPPEELENN